MLKENVPFLSNCMREIISGNLLYLTAGDQIQTYVIKETYPPAGYQGDITCSFHLYYQPYPSESDSPS